MKSSAKKVELAPYDDLFSTEESRQDAKLEKVREIPLSELHPFKNHPFKVKDDEAMMETADSVRQYGVLVPAIARPDPEGGYELVAGHRRHRASELAEKETMPVIVRDLDDDAATIIMVDSNLQRESLLPSERAFAYKMKLEAIKHQGERSDLTSRQVGEKSQTSIQLVASQAGESQRQVQRYIRLTELIPELLDMVDEKKIALNPAYELSFLKKEEQRNSFPCLLSCLGRCKVSGPACTRWICWWGCAAVLACVWRCISKVKTPRSTVMAWSMVLPVGEPVRILLPTSTRCSRTMSFSQKPKA